MRDASTKILRPESDALGELCGRLRAIAARPGASGTWPAEQLDLCRQYGVFEWFVAPEWGGLGWSDSDIIRAYVRLSAACLTTTFVITQRTGALRRIAVSENDWACSQLLPRLCRGELLVTLGISHLTTSRRHLSQPVLRARATDGGYVLDGYSPWVTGARHAQVIVTGATLGDGQQILVALRTSLPGVSIPGDHPLLALRGSATAEVHCKEVVVGREWLLAGPSANVVRQGVGARTGGVQTTALALGLADQAIEFMEAEGELRGEVAAAAARLRERHRGLCDALCRAADGVAPPHAPDLRLRADDLAVQATQAALIVAKGAGYVEDHPASRWVKEALFFLVWSVPPQVLEASLARLASGEASV